MVQEMDMGRNVGLDNINRTKNELSGDENIRIN